jgi:hypothetical protein
MSELGQNGKYSQRAFVVRNSPDSRHRADMPARPSRAKSRHRKIRVDRHVGFRAIFEACPFGMRYNCTMAKLASSGELQSALEHQRAG